MIHLQTANIKRPFNGLVIFTFLGNSKVVQRFMSWSRRGVSGMEQVAAILVSCQHATQPLLESAPERPKVGQRLSAITGSRGLPGTTLRIFEIVKITFPFALREQTSGNFGPGMRRWADFPDPLVSGVTEQSVHCSMVPGQLPGVFGHRIVGGTYVRVRTPALLQSGTPIRQSSLD